MLQKTIEIWKVMKILLQLRAQMENSGSSLQKTSSLGLNMLGSSILNSRCFLKSSTMSIEYQKECRYKSDDCYLHITPFAHFSGMGVLWSFCFRSCALPNFTHMIWNH